ncbi:hypothetical protein J9303_08965 [Bacillaceae bacterium Marseille-Q3522]|nr:hypothetical protein [Bacillaceae bacterium Marseille-Q3522]
MKHYAKEQWLQYVKNEITEEKREEYEAHLYSCDQCLKIYLQAVEAYEPLLPVPADENYFTNKVMESIAKKAVGDKTEKKQHFFQSALFHYVIAAAMTLLLMLTGVFELLPKYSQHINNQKESPSITEGIAEKTFSWLDSINLQNQGGEDK